MAEPKQPGAWKWIGGLVALGLAYGVGYDGGYSEGRKTTVVDSAGVGAAPVAEPSSSAPAAQVADAAQAGSTVLAASDAIDTQGANDAYSATFLREAQPNDSGGELVAYEARPRRHQQSSRRSPATLFARRGTGRLYPTSQRRRWRPNRQSRASKSRRSPPGRYSRLMGVRKTGVATGTLVARPVARRPSRCRAISDETALT